MRTFLISVLVSLLSVCLSAQTTPPTPAIAEVYLVGTVHDFHFRPDNHYSLNDLRREIESLRPDLICGEITPEAYRAQMEGYFPPEAAYLDEIAPALKARFVPADWRIANAWQSRAFAMEPKTVKDQKVALSREMAKGLKEAQGTDTIFDFVHGDFVRLADRMFEEIIGENTVSDIAAGGWHERNRRVVENCLEAAEGARRIVFAFGASHLPQLRSQLAARGVTAKIAPRLFTPSGMGKVPSSLIERWRGNRDNLKAILDGRLKVSTDSLGKVRDSKRVEELDLALQAYSTEAGKL